MITTHTRIYQVSFQTSRFDGTARRWRCTISASNNRSKLGALSGIGIGASPKAALASARAELAARKARMVAA